MDSVRVWKRNCNFWNDPLGENDSHSAKRCPPSKAVCSPLVCPLTEVESIRRPRPVVGRGRSSDWIGQQHLKNPREKEGKRERERESNKERREGGRGKGPRQRKRGLETAKAVSWDHRKISLSRRPSEEPRSQSPLDSLTGSACHVESKQ